MKLTSKYKERFRKVLFEHRSTTVGFRADEVMLIGKKTARREYLTHPGAVGILAFDPAGRILLVKQYRYPVSEFTYEIPAGKLAPRENPASCARRELEEEAGVKTKRLTKLLSFWPTAAFSDEVIHVYLATGLRTTHVHPDEDEYLELLFKSPQQVEAMINRGQIRDSKTIIAFAVWKMRGQPL